MNKHYTRVDRQAPRRLLCSQSVRPDRALLVTYEQEVTDDAGFSLPRRAAAGPLAGSFSP